MVPPSGASRRGGESSDLLPLSCFFGELKKSSSSSDSPPHGVIERMAVGDLAFRGGLRVGDCTTPTAEASLLARILRSDTCMNFSLRNDMQT